MAAERLDVLIDRALGALTGLRVGEVMGAVTDGLPGSAAADALQSAFSDLRAETPGFASAVAALGAGPAPASASAHPWIATAVAAGIEVRADPVAGLLEAVGTRLDPDRRDRLTFAAAAAVAAAVSAALDETPWSQCLSLAISAADIAEATATCAYRAGASVGARLAWAHALGARAEDPLEIIELLVGVSEAPQEAVPAAFAVAGLEATSGRPPMASARAAASLGGRADLVAPVAGALAGALGGVDAFPEHLRSDIDLTGALARREAG